MRNYLCNKRGWVIIVESVIAVIILFSLFFLTLSRQSYGDADAKSYLYDSANLLIEKVQKNDSARNFVLQNVTSEVNAYLSSEIERMKIKINATACISRINQECFVNVSSEEVYAAEYVIASDSSHYSPKKIRIFVWKE